MFERLVDLLVKKTVLRPLKDKQLRDHPSAILPSMVRQTRIEVFGGVAQRQGRGISHLSRLANRSLQVPNLTHPNRTSSATPSVAP